MTHEDPLAELRTEINRANPAHRRGVARAIFQGTKNPILTTLAFALLAMNEDDDWFFVRAEYEMTKGSREDVNAIAATLPPPPAPTGIARNFDPDTQTFTDGYRLPDDSGFGCTHGAIWKSACADCTSESTTSIARNFDPETGRFLDDPQFRSDE